MIDERDRFVQAARRFDPPEDAFERLLHRKQARDRARRIATGALALVIAVAVLGGLGLSITGGQRPSPANPNVTPSQTYTSSVLGYQMSYPQGWTLVNQATKPWVHGHDSDKERKGTIDRYLSPEEAEFTVSSQAVPPGMTAEDWLHDYIGSNSLFFPRCWPRLFLWPKVTIDGQTARLHGKDPFCNFTEAVAIAGGRAYVFRASPGPTCCSMFDPALWDAFISSVKLKPELVSKP
jgi:hypothetical protein